jgi:hypothetical protein
MFFTVIKSMAKLSVCHFILMKNKSLIGQVKKHNREIVHGRSDRHIYAYTRSYGCGANIQR